MKRPLAVLLWLGVLFNVAWTAPSATAAEEKPTRRPNVVFILADDLGWTDLGCYGSRYYETPNIDRLCRQGMKFTAAYTCGPNCAPTRACLMTGRYTPRHGIFTVGNSDRGLERFRKLVPVPNRTRLPLSEQTMAQVFKQAGYATAMFGKWHLGGKRGYHPLQRGFDEAIVTAGRHFRFKTNPPRKVPPDAYLADWLTDRAVDFIRRHRREPFFLYLPHFAVHTPLQAKEELIAKYRRKPPVGGHNNPVYAAMIDSLDQSVGRILATLDELGLSRHTIVIFTSDNGGVGGYGSLGGPAGRNITDNSPLRRGKGCLYEGGIRVPLVVRWPECIPPGSVCHEPVITVDFLATFRQLLRIDSPPKNPLDGLSLLELWRSGGKARLDREAIYWHFPAYLQANVRRGTWRTTPAGAIRTRRYKLIEYFEDGRLELYDLQNDIGERHNLAAKQPELARRLHQMLKDWRRRVGAPMPRPKHQPAG